MGKPLFITFEGCDGTGKSTLLQGMARELRKKHDVMLTREPGASLGGATIRDMLFNDNPGTAAMLPGQADCLLLYDHIGVSQGVIAPALESGKWVLCDRYADSQFAYSAGKPHSKSINEAYAKHYGPVPDITFLLIGDVRVFSARAKSRDASPDAVEPGKQQRKIWNQIEAQQRIQDAYLIQLSNQPRTVILNIDGLNADEVLHLALARLEVSMSKPPAAVNGRLFEKVA